MERQRLVLFVTDASEQAAVAQPVLETAFETALSRSNRLALMPVVAVKAVQTAQGVAETGPADRAAAQKVARALFSDIAIVVRQTALRGRVVRDEQSIGGLVRTGPTRYNTRYELSVQLEAVNVETNEVVLSRSVTERVNGPVTRTALRAPEEFSTVLPAYRTKVTEIANSLVLDLLAAQELNVVIVLVRDAANVAVNLGAEAGITVGARFEVVDEGEPIRDPSGAILGQDSRVVASGEVVRVEPQLAWVRLSNTVDGSGTADSVPNVARVRRNMPVRLLSPAPQP